MLSLMLVFVMASETDHRSVYDASSLGYSRYIYAVTDACVCNGQ